MDLNEKKALVTGATGFVGGRLAERLLSEGVTVRALVRSSGKAERFVSRGVEIVQGDVTDRDSVRRASEGCQMVFHCAAMMHDGQAPVAEFRRVNVEGTRHMLEAAAEVGVSRFVHISSIAVYGISPRAGTKETDPYQPCHLAYCDTKIEAEQVAFNYSAEKGLPLVVIRPANVYGPGSSFWTVALVMMIKSGQLKLIDDGRGMANHVYIDNLVDAILLAAQNDAAVGEAFIVSDGAGTDWKEFLGHYARMLGRDPLPSMSQDTARQHMPSEIVGFWTQEGWFDIGKARTMLGYEPRISLDEGMKLTEAWLREAGYLSAP
jgi:nucleoside-diphosphate-sugar epimerase